MDETVTRAELRFGPRYRKSPFFEATRRAGCRSWGIYNHMYLPDWYADPVEEYRSLTEDAALWDAGVQRVVEISGPDASELVNRLTPRDLTRCAVGQGRYAPLTAEDGGIVNEPVALRLGENRWWLSLSDSDAGLWARGYAAGSGLDARVREPEIHPLQLQGPKSPAVMAALFGEAALRLGYYRTMETALDGIPVVVSRTGWTGELGFEIYLCDPARGGALWDRVMEAGAAHGIRAIAPSQIRRVEAGIFRYGADMTIENNPFEVTGLERLVEDQSADYLGKAALMRIRAEGVRRKLVGVALDAAAPVRAAPDAAPARSGGREVGKVTSLVWSPRLGRNVGYVWVPAALAAPGNRIEVDTLDGSFPASTAPLPFVDPGKKIPTAPLTGG